MLLFRSFDECTYLERLIGRKKVCARKQSAVRVKENSQGEQRKYRAMSYAAHQMGICDIKAVCGLLIIEDWDHKKIHRL